MKFIFLISFIFVSYSVQSQETFQIKIVPNPAKKMVDVLVDNQLFTSYIYPDEIKKPVLWPVISPGGNEITRSYPLKSVPGERVDHPHHVGIWFNYGNVNGLDFWNNSNAITMEKRSGYGTIFHQKVIGTKSGEKGLLVTSSLWKDYTGKTLLEETTEFNFMATDDLRIIDRTTVLKAVTDKVNFTDNKEGMFAIRVARELELPTDEELRLSDDHGNITTVTAPDNSVVTGNYLSSEGISGEEVWGTRAIWMKLSGEIKGEKLAIIIFDHPENPGYPTHWHARGYGLFAANTLGQKVFSEGKIEMNFALNKGESVTFRYRVAIYSRDPSSEEIEELLNSFE